MVHLCSEEPAYLEQGKNHCKTYVLIITTLHSFIMPLTKVFLCWEVKINLIPSCMCQRIHFYRNFIPESLADRAEQWNSVAPEPSRILCRFLSVIPPPVGKSK